MSAVVSPPDEAYLARARAQQRARARWRQRPRVEGEPTPAPPQAGSAEEDMRCAADSSRFINNFVMIEQPQAQHTEPTMAPFHLWPEQVGVLAKLALQRLVIILKARQLGLSWLVCAYALWLCMYRAGQTVLIFSKTDVECEEMVRRISVMYKNLPEWMRQRHPILANNTHRIVFRNNSRIRAMTSTTSGGRTFTASLAIMDEAAFMAKPAELYTAMKPTIDGGGQLIIISTFDKVDDFFDKMWIKAVNKVNRFIAIFLPWMARPDRTQEWYNMVAAEAVSMAHHLREYPSTWEEARQVLETERFIPNMTFWDSCAGLQDFPVQKTPIVLGVDGAYASAGDSFGLVGVGRHPKNPAEMLVVRIVRKWQAKKGQPALNFAEIEKEIISICRQWRVVCIAYDPKDLHQMFGEGSKIQSLGIVTEKFNQGAPRLVADKNLYDRIMNGTIMHSGMKDASKGGSKDDLWEHIDNSDRYVYTDGSFRIVKRSEEKKIDLAVAASMAVLKGQELLPAITTGGGVAMGSAKSNWLGGKE